MAEFKKGDRIRAVRDTTSKYGTPIPKDATGTVVESPYADLAFRPDDGSLGKRRHVPPEDFEHVNHGTGDGSASDICAEPGCNCDLERRFPAPLDPKAVKPGDTATVTDGKAIITGVVDSVRERAAQLWFRFRFGEQADAYFEVPLSDRFGEAFNLTAHQPAPEPKPYTPTREQIRQAYVDARGDADLITESEAGAEFDRWLDSLGLNR